MEHREIRDAISIANWFITKGNSDNVDITLLKLVKLVYIAHGYILALLEESYINPMYDRVEAWKFGPVIPSVYHTFKHNRDNCIKNKESICTINNNSDKLEFFIPKVKDNIVQILNFVWNRYGSKTPSELVSILHRKGTPWEYYYKKGKNNEIPDYDTKLYYKAIIRELSK